MTTPSRHALERPHSDGPRPRRRRFSVPPRTLDALLPLDAADLDDKFFVPTYLNHSVYMQRLETDWKTKLRDKQTKASPENGVNVGSSGFPPAALPTGSYRGLSHTVVERSSSNEEHEVLAPLPSKWNKDDKWGGIELGIGNVVRYTPKNYHDRDRDHEASAVRANNHMPPQCGIYYYEVTILDSKKDDTTIAIGFSTKAATLSRPIGWEPESWAYHGDDGRIFTAQHVGKQYGPCFNKGDVIGCGVNFKDNNAFFTRNGILLGIAFHDLARGRLFPAVSLKRPGEKVRANFGQEPFIFDIDKMAKDHRTKIRHEIASTNTSRLEPGVSESDLIQALVLQFLQHDGYVDTARAFAAEMKASKASLDTDASAKTLGIDIKDDEDATNRQRIRSAVLEGDIDRALKYTQAFYPNVLVTSDLVHFRLRCRKFIEMVRRAAELKSSNSPPNNSNGLSSDSSSQQMDIDQNGMEVDSGDNKAALSELELDTLMYGQALQADYANDPREEIVTGLREIWALLPYKNPLREPHIKHLLDQQGRVVVAEELNSAILSSLGKSSRAALEKVYAQTTVLLEELRRDGGEGAFVSVDDTVDEIPDSNKA